MSNHEASNSGQPSLARRWGATLSITAVSTLIALGIAELTVAYVVPVRDVGPSFTVDDPIYGKRNKANARITRRTPEFVMEFRTNAQGFRQQRNVAVGSGPEVFLGDSFTVGYGVDEGEQFVALLQSRRGELPLLNAGIGNNGNGRWVKFLRLAAPNFEPRLVVLQMMANDFEENAREGLFELRGGELIERSIPPPSTSRNLQLLVEAVPGLASSHLVGLIRQVLAVGSPADAQGATPRMGTVALRSTAAAEDASIAAGDALTMALVARADRHLPDQRSARPRPIGRSRGHSSGPTRRPVREPRRRPDSPAWQTGATRSLLSRRWPLERCWPSSRVRDDDPCPERPVPVAKVVQGRRGGETC